MTRGDLDLSVIIPAYNEGKRIAATLLSVGDWLADDGRVAEVIVVDDGSEDDTVNRARSSEDERVIVLRHPMNLGKGAAIRTGVEASRGRNVLICDADLSAPMEELTKLETVLSPSTPIVCGSRSVVGSVLPVPQPFHRRVMGRVFRELNRGLGLTTLHDTQCGFKLLRGEVARELIPRLETDRFAYDVELLARAQHARLHVAEVGIVWRDASGSTVDSLRDPVEMLVSILRIWRRKRQGFRT